MKKEFAFFLYKKGMATMGVARRLAGISKWEFIDSLGERKIERHYSKKELKEDQNDLLERYTQEINENRFLDK